MIILPPRASGEWQLTVLRSDGSPKGPPLHFRNIVLNPALTTQASMGSPSVAVTMRVGTSAAAPQVTDTPVLSPIGSPTGASGITHSNATPENGGVHSWTVSADFTGIVGNVAEVGCYVTYPYVIDISRALVRDASGNPTTVTVLSGEILRASYVITFYAHASTPIPWSGTIAGASRSGQVFFGSLQPRLPSAAGDLWLLGSATPAGTPWTAPTISTYIRSALPALQPGGPAGSYLCRYSFGPAEGSGSIGALEVSAPVATTYITISPPIVKTSLDTLTIDIAFPYLVNA